MGGLLRRGNNKKHIMDMVKGGRAQQDRQRDFGASRSPKTQPAGNRLWRTFRPTHDPSPKEVSAEIAASLAKGGLEAVRQQVASEAAFPAAALTIMEQYGDTIGASTVGAGPAFSAVAIRPKPICSWCSRDARRVSRPILQTDVSLGDGGTVPSPRDHVQRALSRRAR